MKFLADTYRENIELQIILSFALGLLFAPMSYGIEYTFLFIIIFEFYVFIITTKYPPCIRFVDRLLINLFFIFGWIISRINFCNETGMERFLFSCG